MIPKTITKEHIIEAARSIDSNPVPEHREAKRYEVTVNGHNYPPKYLISVAAQMVTGHPLKPDEFGGGDETNGFLKRHGFVVHEIGHSRPERASAKCSVRIARAWLTMEMTMTEFKKAPKDPRADGSPFKRMVEEKHFSQKDYYQRLKRLAHDAKNAGADILVLPACAMMYKGEFNPREILGNMVPGIIASGKFYVGQQSRVEPRETAVILQGGQGFDTGNGVRCIRLKGRPFSIMAAVSSTIKKIRAQPGMHCTPPPGELVTQDEHAAKCKPEPKANSQDNNDPVLVLDMGHQRYSSHYLLHTLRKVWESQSLSRRVVVILSSWHYQDASYETSWTWPFASNTASKVSNLVKKAKYVTWQKGSLNRYGDVLDIIDVDLPATRKRRANKLTNAQLAC